ncbi:hypothetical protein Misp02_66160 [Microtetraspora sp. NBRC 16547]|nr:hypothetical protein Misp02_66160 [Microtetraspora sp. NBRC 16547]
MQVLAYLMGRPVWASPALPGAVHDVTAARTVGLIDTLTGVGVMTFADNGYKERAADPPPFKGHRPWLSRAQKDVQPLPRPHPGNR